MDGNIFKDKVNDCYNANATLSSLSNTLNKSSQRAEEKYLIGGI